MQKPGGVPGLPLKADRHSSRFKNLRDAWTRTLVNPEEPYSLRSLSYAQRSSRTSLARSVFCMLFCHSLCHTFSQDAPMSMPMICRETQSRDWTPHSPLCKARSVPTWPRLPTCFRVASTLRLSSVVAASSPTSIICCATWRLTRASRCLENVAAQTPFASNIWITARQQRGMSLLCSVLNHVHLRIWLGRVFINKYIPLYLECTSSHEAKSGGQTRRK